jgi:hypothetical protein
MIILSFRSLAMLVMLTMTLGVVVGMLLALRGVA